jgi:hypothetical protein
MDGKNGAKREKAGLQRRGSIPEANLAYPTASV